MRAPKEYPSEGQVMGCLVTSHNQYFLRRSGVGNVLLVKKKATTWLTTLAMATNQSKPSILAPETKVESPISFPHVPTARPTPPLSQAMPSNGDASDFQHTPAAAASSMWLSATSASSSAAAAVHSLPPKPHGHGWYAGCPAPEAAMRKKEQKVKLTGI